MDCPEGARIGTGLLLRTGGGKGSTQETRTRARTRVAGRGPLP